MSAETVRTKLAHKSFNTCVSQNCTNEIFNKNVEWYATTSPIICYFQTKNYFQISGVSPHLDIT